jgi:hypothetical protein
MPALGLVAGGGGLPLALAGAAARKGRLVEAVAFRDHTNPRLERAATVTWLRFGEIEPGLDAFRRAGVREVVLAGALPKARLLRPDALAADSQARRLLGRLPDRRDGSLLRALAGLLESHGLDLLPQASLAPELVAGEGLLAGRAPSPALWRDIQRGFRVAKRVAAEDVGQTVVVKEGVVLAVEAIEGTDAAIRRAGAFAAGACAVKVAAPDQDPRFDLPVLGPDTLRSAREAGLAVVAFEAGRCLVLERERLAAEARAAGLCVVGVKDQGSVR